MPSRDRRPAGSRSSDWDAAAYDRVADPQFAWGQKVLARLPIAGHETILDAGCGTGRLTAEILDQAPHGRVAAVDASASMLRLAREHLLPRFGSRTWLVQADVAALPFRDAFDLIFSTATFHWVLDHDQLFENLYAALKPGGRLVAQCGGGPNLARLLGRAARLMAVDPFAPFFTGWRDPWLFPDDLSTTKRLHATGFIEAQSSLEPALTVFPTARDFGEFIATVVVRHHLARIPDQRLRERFVDALMEQAAGDAPPYALDYWRLNLQGRKRR